MPPRPAEFGDYQTPDDLAAEVCRLLLATGIQPKTIIEPTCGIGNLLVAAARAFPDAARLTGADINPAYVGTAAVRLAADRRSSVRTADFFAEDWTQLIAADTGPVLVVGNPPWVTSADVGKWSGTNLPPKSNFDRRAGLAAKTGGSNFDIAEWMLLQLLRPLSQRVGWLAVLCKRSVARKLLARFWTDGVRFEAADLYPINAKRWFGAAVDAGLLVVRCGPGAGPMSCTEHAGLDASPQGEFGWRAGKLVADAAAYDLWHHLDSGRTWGWRSGVKHDCAAVFELAESGGSLADAAGRVVDVEPSAVYPLLKSSDLAGGRLATHRRLLITQTSLDANPDGLRATAPAAWSYLEAAADRLAARRSSIYRGRHRFAQFGVGPYTFAAWKVAVAGLYKQVRFQVVGPVGGQPVVFDDTCYFLPCPTADTAARVGRLLDSDPARGYLQAFTFADAKRPITAALLSRLDLDAVADCLRERPTGVRPTGAATEVPAASLFG